MTLRIAICILSFSILPSSLLAAGGPGGCNGFNTAPLSAIAPNSPSSRILDLAPAYEWYHGCGPTAAGSIIGYWDLHGYPNLFDASGTAVFLTANVQDQISSSAHNAKYDPTPDAPGPTPPYTSIADWFRTSVDLGFGWSYLSDAPAAFSGYARYRGYQFDAQNRYFGTTFSWDDFTSVRLNDQLRPLVSG